ncbi:MAG: hypothetical protein EOO32_03440 [Comamonadaceae bacterium]|nr:MAG: hypothetical protein EOO32_03440 [Comamonadaceae bacterium]
MQLNVRWHRRLAWLWLAFALGVLGHNVWLWAGPAAVLDSDVLAMLPQDEQRPLVTQATQAMADAGARRVVVLLGSQDAQRARNAGDAFAASLQGALTLRYRVAENQQLEWLQFYAPYRQGLLAPDQRHMLQALATEPLAQEALASLHQPLGMPRLGAWSDDPLQLHGRWLTERAQLSRVRVEQGRLMLEDDGWHYAVLMLEAKGSAFAVAQQQGLVERLAVAAQAARAAQGALQGGTPELRVLQAGVPLFAAAAAAQAQREVHTIGAGSLIGVVLLTWCAFRSLRPRLLVTLSMGLGLAAAVSITQWVFGSLHLITLVFGATLLGVAENYGSNYFCARMGQPRARRFDVLARQLPMVSLAMLTTVMAYALLAVAPLPGLRQIALFSASGLLAAFTTVILWFPWLDGEAAQASPFALWLGGLRARWPQPRRRAAWLLGLAFAGLLAAGAVRLQRDDDVRNLQNAPAALIQDQREVSRLLDLPGVAQFYLVQGATEQQLLQREEALADRVRALGVRVQAVSDWVPSLARQAQDQALRRSREEQVLAALSRTLDERLQPASATTAQLLPGAWQASPVSEPLRYQWLGMQSNGQWASAVLLRAGAGALPVAALAALEQPQAGVLWVDKVQDISGLLERTGGQVTAIVLIGYALVWAALAWRFGRRAWRGVAPTAVASVATVALLACMGQPIQLFHLLPLLILLGLGVDYGIFMLEQPGRDEVQPFLSVSLAAMSTLLSFGLLALSGTPALRAFGLTMLIGVSLAWWLTPVFLPVERR